MDKGKKFLAIAQNVSDEVDRYSQIFMDVIDVTDKLPSQVDDLKHGIVTHANKTFAAARQFIATIGEGSGEVNIEVLQEKLEQGQAKLSQLGNIVGLVLKDEDKNNLPDWFDKIEVEYKKIFDGKDLIPRTNIDDRFFLHISNLHDVLKEYITIATDNLKELDLQAQIAKAEKWLEETGKFISAVTGFVEHLKAGDLFKMYQDVSRCQEL